MDEHKYYDNKIEELCQDHKRFEEIAGTHLIKSDFYWIAGIFVTLTLMAFGAIMNRLTNHIDDDKKEFDKTSDKHTEFQVTYATIQTNLAQIQKDILEIKTQLKDHSTKDSK